MSDQKYGVMVGPFSGAMYIGKVRSSGGVLRDKEDATERIFYAVAQFVDTQYEGGAVINVGDYELVIDVTSRKP